MFESSFYWKLYVKLYYLIFKFLAKFLNFYVMKQWRYSSWTYMYKVKGTLKQEQLFWVLCWDDTFAQDT